METAKGIVERPGEAAEDPLRTEFTTTNALVYVEFEGENDPMDPHNWPLGSRYAYQPEPFPLSQAHANRVSRLFAES